MAHNASNVYLAYRTLNAVDAGRFWGYQAYLDTDNNTATGYQNDALGAEYMLEGQTVWRYTGDGESWSWSPQGSTTNAISGQAAEFSFPRSWIGNPSKLRLMFRGNNAAFGGNAEDVYPNATANPRYFEYRF